MPRIFKVKQGDDLWSEYQFDNKSGCAVVSDSKEIEGTKQAEYTFYVNVDNVFLHQEMKVAKEPELIEAKYVYGNVLLGLALIHAQQDSKNVPTNDYEENGEFNVEEQVKTVSRAMSPFIVPMINYLGSLTVEDVSLLAQTGDDD